MPLAFGATGCVKLKARDLLNKGVAAYKDGKYDQAIEDFKQAKDLDPTLINARTVSRHGLCHSVHSRRALGTRTSAMGEQAVKEFQDVLTVDPNNISAIDGIGSILYNMAGTPFTPSRFEESKTYHMKHIALKPEDPDPYYWVGVIDWTLAYRSHLEMRGKWRLAHPGKALKDDEPMPADVREDYTKENGQLIDEGIANLRKAIELRPDYDDAMAYLNLLLRRKADEAATPDERASLLQQADDLIDKAKEIKQKKMEAPAKS